MPAVLIAVWLLGAPAPPGAPSRTEPQRVVDLASASRPSTPLHALLERREGAGSAQGQCAALVEEICRRASPELCERVRREAETRPPTEEDQRACRAILDDPAQLRRLLRGGAGG